VKFEIDYLPYHGHAEARGWHVSTKTTNDEWHELMSWLNENNIDPIFYYGKIVLPRESDVALFLLRWA
jgi:hypothetical protein